MLQPTQDRRTNRRYAVTGLTGNLHLDSDAAVLNLSQTGMEVETRAWMAVGRTYRFRMHHGGGVVPMDGRVQWCRLVGTRSLREGESQAVYRAGLHFSEVEGRRAALTSLIEEVGVVEVDRRLGGRFRVRREAAVNVTFERDFRVASLSRNELTIDADLLLEEGGEYVLEFSAGERAEPITATVLVQALSPLRDDDGGPLFRIRTRLVDVAPEDRAALGSLIHDEVRGGGFLGNGSTGVFHHADCKHAEAAELRYTSRRAAVEAGLRPGGCCSP